MSIDGDVLTVYAIIIDSINASLPNFSDGNFKAIVLRVLRYCFSKEVATGRSEAERFMEAAHKTSRLFHPSPIDQSKNEKMCIQSLSKWLLADLRADDAVSKTNPELEDLPESHPKIKGSYSEEVQSEMTFREAVSKDEVLKWMLEQTMADTGTETEYEKDLKFKVFDEYLCVGRNFFLGGMGYCGVGPAGKCGAQGSQAAVQIGDVLALVYGAPPFMIIRPQEDGTYIVVGACHVGNFGEIQSPIFKDGELPELVAMKIR